MIGPINVARVKQLHDSMWSSLNTELNAEMEMSGEAAKAHVRQFHTGFTHRSFKLSNSTSYRVVRTRGGKVVKIRNTAPYARAVENGSRPHVIRAKNGGALRFVMNGRVMFRRSVNHPGTKPTKFLRTATEFAFERFGRGMDQRIRRLSARFKRAR